MTIEFYRYPVDEHLKPCGAPVFTEFSGNTPQEINEQVFMAKANNDMTKWTPFRFHRVVSI